MPSYRISSKPLKPKHPKWNDAADVHPRSWTQHANTGPHQGTYGRKPQVVSSLAMTASSAGNVRLRAERDERGLAAQARSHVRDALSVNWHEEADNRIREVRSQRKSSNTPEAAALDKRLRTRTTALEALLDE